VLPRWDLCGPVFVAQARRATISDVGGLRVSDRRARYQPSGSGPFGLDPKRLDRRPSEASSWNALFVEFYLL
jgi:hypothetical protein